MAVFSRNDQRWMQLAIETARRGEGHVEPNPMVGCVIVHQDRPLGIGAHLRFGGPHAEINALDAVAPEDRRLLADSTAFVTLEPCAHHGKTGPCADALIEAGIGSVVVAVEDPNPAVAGQGMARLRQAGIQVRHGLLESDARQVLAPYLKRVQRGLPWTIAKWAMTIDGKIASRTGDSQWISNQASRTEVHQLRGRMDAILVGIGTALADDPMLNARTPQPPPRVATRIVLDSAARLPLTSKLVQSADEIPVLIAVTEGVAPDKVKSLQDHGCEVRRFASRDQILPELLSQLSGQGITNLLVEGGAGVLGTLNELDMIDEIQLFLGPMLLGGAAAPSPVGGLGVESLRDSAQFQLATLQQRGDDIHGVYRRVCQD